MKEFIARLWRSEDAFVRALRGAFIGVGTVGLTKVPETPTEWASIAAVFLGGFIGVGDKNEPTKGA